MTPLRPSASEPRTVRLRPIPRKLTDLLETVAIITTTIPSKDTSIITMAIMGGEIDVVLGTLALLPDLNSQDIVRARTDFARFSSQVENCSDVSSGVDKAYQHRRSQKANIQRAKDTLTIYQFTKIERARGNLNMHELETFRRSK